MNKKLSVVSRILISFASGALIAVFFLPVWRIDLFAPQYPEGLTMNIWINGLSGEVDVINGLNHYIGMKHIKESMFPEFGFLPYIVMFFMLFGAVVAITGKRRLLLVYLGLTVVGGALAMIDFYKWGYNYGKDLDPTAPIQVPGLSYQPPLLGHKRLLNFDAYSLPDIGGWVVIAAAALAFAVWFAEWYHQRRQAKKTVMKPASLAVLLMLSFAFASCTTKTEPINYGKDNCYFCKMGIADPKFGGELVTKKGKIYKFDDVLCMVQFLRTGAVNEGSIAQKMVINYDRKDHFIDAGSAVFLLSPEIKSPMGSNAAAFASQAEAKKINAEKQGRILSWNELYNAIK